MGNDASFVHDKLTLRGRLAQDVRGNVLRERGFSVDELYDLTGPMAPHSGARMLLVTRRMDT